MDAGLRYPGSSVSSPDYLLGCVNLGKLLTVLKCCFHQYNGLGESVIDLLGDLNMNLGKAVDTRLQKEQDRAAVDSCADCA